MIVCDKCNRGEGQDVQRHRIEVAEMRDPRQDVHNYRLLVELDLCPACRQEFVDLVQYAVSPPVRAEKKE